MLLHNYQNTKYITLPNLQVQMESHLRFFKVLYIQFVVQLFNYLPSNFKTNNLFFKNLHNYIKDHNFSFKTDHDFISLISLLISLLDYNFIICNIDKEMDIMFIFRNISKVFDKGWHKNLIYKLQKYIIRVEILDGLNTVLLIER